MSSEEALKILLPYLWEYEKTEIQEFETIYFFNINERKKGLSSTLMSSLNQRNSSSERQQPQPGSGSSRLNHGFDNEQQEYNV
jgi:hypothetical protein